MSESTNRFIPSGVTWKVVSSFDSKYTETLQYSVLFVAILGALYTIVVSFSALSYSGSYGRNFLNIDIFCTFLKLGNHDQKNSCYGWKQGNRQWGGGGQRIFSPEYPDEINIFHSGCHILY